MRYYVIINGVNSLTIEGLAIKTLPPISKPAMRNLREEIDGRDGDITTELGYGAYDKTLEIGLYGNYDINKIIAFFNSKGKIIFSDEPDKYYNFEIVDKIDYTKLVKFRTATINIHCQPFKYPVSEEPQVEEYEYVEATGTNVTLDNTSEGIFNKIELLGNTSQASTPTPDAPVSVNVVSGDNKIVINSKNLFAGGNTTTHNGITFTKNNDGSYNIVGTATSTAYLLNYVPLGESGIINGETYTISLNQVIQDLELRIESYNGNTWLRATMGGLITFPKTHSADVTDATSVRFGLFVQSGKTVNITNLKIMLEKGSSASSYLPCSRDTYDIDLPVENLWGGFSNSLSRTDSGVQFTVNQDGTITASGTATNVATSILLSEATSNGIYKTLQKGTYTVSGGGAKYSVEVYDKNNVVKLGGIPVNGSSVSFTINSETQVVLRIQVANGITINETIKLQLEKGSSANTYTPYGTTPIELCKIGDYQDYIYKEGKKWYLHKEIGKVVLNGSENWNKHGNIASWFYYDGITNGYVLDNTQILIKTNYYTPKAYQGVPNLVNGECSYGSSDGGITHRFVIKNIDYTQVADFKTWLGTHNTIVYYMLATPTSTEITDTTLLEQLEAIKNAVSYGGQTNVSQINNDLPFILDLSALKEGSDHLVINNAGNIYAKPTIDIEGTGVVDIYLNDVQILEADLSETNNIVIDTEAMEAYNPDTNALANRQVTGDYSKIKLEPGENDLRFSGDLSKATVTNYKRWL